MVVKMSASSFFRFSVDQYHRLVDAGVFSPEDRCERDIETLIEVADSSLLADRRRKGQVYAEAGIRQFWLVNITAGKVEVYSKPSAGKYGRCQTYKKNESVPLIVAGERIALLPVSGFFAR